MKLLLSKCFGEMENPNDHTNAASQTKGQDWRYFAVVLLLSNEWFSHMCLEHSLDSYREGFVNDWEWAMKGTILYWTLLCSSHCSGPLCILSHANFSTILGDKGLWYPFIESANWDTTKLRNLLKVTKKKGDFQQLLESGSRWWRSKTSHSPSPTNTSKKHISM